MSQLPRIDVPAFTARVHKRVGESAQQPCSVQELNGLLRTLATWRAILLSDHLVGRDGTTISSGPFEGMTYVERASEGSLSARLLGAYEFSLFGVIEEIITSAYGTLIDIGCSDGYYAVGFARRMPNTRVLAYDTDAAARDQCAALAGSNGVSDRITIGATFSSADFALCLEKRTIVFCDIEGAEDELLRPEASPGLAAADILVESHEILKPGLTDELTRRFEATHDITRLGRRLTTDPLPDWAEGLSELDRLLMLWDWRGGSTPWLWMKSQSMAR
ncbi:MAG: hypothetical protein AAF401_05655 [Pseudomonadota bacterium]